MDIDELKRAWSEMELRQDGMEALLGIGFRENRLGKVRAALRPLFWGQLLQLALGVVLSVWGAGLWATQVGQIGVLVCGLVVHAYGLLLIGFAARNLYLVQAIDFAAPVLDVQRSLAKLRAFRVSVETPINFVACCFVWIPVAWAALAAIGVHPALGGFLAWALASSVIGMLAIGVVVWAMRRLGHGQRVEDESAGRSVTRAQAALDDIARFERE
ncbi:MAG TPA: hypothetical protein VFL63_08690 [Rhodanobacteraceae bacterium]|nr:hypothetical protein [Rhodanobacteraceae bacterium]